MHDGPVRWGICGTGRIAQKMVEQLASIDDAEVVCVSSADPQRAQRFARRNSIPLAHGSRRAMASDDSVDVVYVANTQDGHHDTVLTMLEGGRAVLCEKPMAMNAAQVESMCAEAGARGLFLMEALWSRFSGAWLRTRELLEQGEIGSPVLLRADLSTDVDPHQRDTHRLWDPARGGGALMDIGIYPLNLAVFLFGRPKLLGASGQLEGDDLDRRVSVLLEHDGGTASLVTTGIDFDGGSAAQVVGTGGTITIRPRMHASPAIEVTSGGTSRLIELGRPGLGIQVPEVQRCLRSGLLESPVMPWAESLAIHRLTDEIRDRIGLRFAADRA